MFGEGKALAKHQAIVSSALNLFGVHSMIEKKQQN